MQPQDLAYRSIVLDDERVQAWRGSPAECHPPIADHALVPELGSPIHSA